MKKQMLFLAFILLLFTGCQNAGTDTDSLIQSTEITAPENITKSKEKLLDKHYYSSGSDWSKTFKKLDEYIGSNEPWEVFESTNHNTNPDNESAFIFYNDLIKQEYVVDLININSEIKTTIDNWKFNLRFLEDNYELISGNPDIDMNIIDSYIEDYKYQLLTENLPDSKPLTKTAEPH